MTKFQPGQSGNPNGRPLKSRALTDILEAAGDKTVHIKGKKRGVARKRLVAEMLWQLVAEGIVTLPDGTELRPEPKDWLETMKWIYKHIDGPPTKSIDIMSDGEKIGVIGLGVDTDKV